MEMAYKITEVCGDWALHIPPYRKTDAEMLLIFNSRNNAELVKSVLEWEDAHPNKAVPHKPTFIPPNEPLTLDSRLTPKMVTCPKGWKGVRYTRFHCPGCKKVVKKGEAYCHKCGQALVFPIQRYDKENNRIWLDFSDRRPPEGEADA